MMPESTKYWPKIFLKPILRTLHRSARGFLAASQREWVLIKTWVQWCLTVSRMPSAFQWLMYRHRDRSGIS
ncbi:hypothetical protein [Methanomethylovorans sp. PtaU1.Bin093]|jgi:hypothetical protein|uniref:hypothetical protein n=1 Tax=Methanomethylovorans sp. PtaU1.Bin093 TaxID=1811679 RepID=UPI0025DDF721|nr:hypothetical protein [Methanomethylovorans sp. PtaU1.Bin093]